MSFKASDPFSHSNAKMLLFNIISVSTSELLSGIFLGCTGRNSTKCKIDYQNVR